MDHTSRFVSNRKTRKGWIPDEPTATLDLLPKSELEPLSSLAPGASNLPAAAPECPPAETLVAKFSLWTRISAISNVLMLRLIMFLRPNYSAPWAHRPTSRVRLGLKWVVTFYLVFSLITFRPYNLFLWLSEGALDSVALFGTAKPHKSVYGTMTASFMFSKLAPHLGNLAPNAFQLAFDRKPTQEHLWREQTITACIWIQGTHINALDEWIRLSGCHTSVLVTTPHPPESPDFRKLAKDVRGITRRSPDARSRIILLSTPTQLSNTNTFINLARLLAQSSWTLLIPPTLEPLLPSDNFPQAVSKLEPHVQAVDHASLFRTFQTEPMLDGILVPQDYPVWCSERYTRSSPGQEWLNCINNTLLHDRNELSLAVKVAQEGTETSTNGS